MHYHQPRHKHQGYNASFSRMRAHELVMEDALVSTPYLSFFIMITGKVQCSATSCYYQLLLTIMPLTYATLFFSCNTLESTCSGITYFYCTEIRDSYQLSRILLTKHAAMGEQNNFLITNCVSPAQGGLRRSLRAIRQFPLISKLMIAVLSQRIAVRSQRITTYAARGEQNS